MLLPVIINFLSSLKQRPEICNFLEEKEHLLACLPRELIGRIEHFGSTAVPGLTAKPIIDMLVEVASLWEARHRIVPILESQGYDYFWRPTWAMTRRPSMLGLSSEIPVANGIITFTWSKAILNTGSASSFGII
ncbi:GrpB protein [uncultured archaeon]|nr:GrpB protein [uncultured archaeon]